jgi:Fic family protein
MPDDKALTLRQADSLYQGFPDFADWPAPTEEDLGLWDRFALRLQEMRENATPEALRKSVEVAVRAAAMDTGAIEGLYTVDRGFTMTVATQAIAWEHALDEKGENVRALFEAQLEAYELVIDAVTKKLPITEAWIRALHEKVCAGQQTYRVWTDQGWQEQELLKGAYKTQPNHVRLADGSIYPYAPVDRVSAEMYRLLEQIRTPEFESAHPIAQASYLHYGFVVIHPFADGNGRVARALASVFFYRALSVPFLVFANQRRAYFDALHEADLGSSWPLIAFFRDRGIDTIQLVIEQLLTVQAPALERVAAQIRLDDTALRIIPLLREEIKSQTGRLGLSDRLSVLVTPYPDPFPPPFGYRAVAYGEPAINVTVQDKSHEVSRFLRISVADGETNPFTFLVDSGAREDRLEIRLEDAYPEISDNLRIRLSNWVRRYLGSLLEEWRRHEVPF